MDKILQPMGGSSELTVTNDGATILRGKNKLILMVESFAGEKPGKLTGCVYGLC
jgi:hypothetical protein